MNSEIGTPEECIAQFEKRKGTRVLAMAIVGADGSTRIWVHHECINLRGFVWAEDGLKSAISMLPALGTAGNA